MIATVICFMEKAGQCHQIFDPAHVFKGIGRPSFLDTHHFRSTCKIFYPVSGCASENLDLFFYIDDLACTFVRLLETHLPSIDIETSLSPFPVCFVEMFGEMKMVYLLLGAFVAVGIAGPAKRDCPQIKCFNATNGCGVAFGEYVPSLSFV
jgi:hypothetical protein